MDALLEPPEDFALELPVLETRAACWFRVHRAAYGAVHFDRSPGYRFNAPDGQFGVLYMSETPEGAFAETFVRGRTRPPRVTERKLRDGALSSLARGPLRLADFAGYGLVSLGLDGRITNGDCYALCRRWSAWVHGHPSGVDGIAYCARNAPRDLSVALFDRAGLPSEEVVVEPRFLVASGLLTPLGRKLVSCFGAAIVRT